MTQRNHYGSNGFPEGELGRMLQTVHVIKVNGLEYLFEPFRDIPAEQTPA